MQVDVKYNNEIVASLTNKGVATLPVKDLTMLSDIYVIVPDAIIEWDGTGGYVEFPNDDGTTFVVSSHEEISNAYGTTCVI